MDKSNTYIPTLTLCKHTLPLGAKLLYGDILTRSLATGYCESTNEILGDAILISPRRVQEYIAMLVKQGLIIREILVDPQTKSTTGRRLYPEQTVITALNNWLHETGATK